MAEKEHDQNSNDNKPIDKVLIDFIADLHRSFPESKDELLKLFGISILIYALFIMSSRASLMFTSVILVLLLILFILNTIALKKKEENNEEEYKKYMLSKNIIFIILIILCSTGTIMYIIDKHKEYGDNFTILSFLFEDTKFNNAKSKKI